MRRDFSQYFEDPDVICVVGIKMFVGEGDAFTPIITILAQLLRLLAVTGRTPCQRAAAVKWARTAAGIISEDVCDFGILPISTGARASFSRVVEHGLPGVARARWAARRFEPVPFAALDPPPPAGNWRAFVRAVARHVAAISPLLAGALYGGVSPVFRFDAATLAAFIHNLPPGTPAIADFVLDLGRVFHSIESTGPPV